MKQTPFALEILSVAQLGELVFVFDLCGRHAAVLGVVGCWRFGHCSVVLMMSVSLLFVVY